MQLCLATVSSQNCLREVAVRQEERNAHIYIKKVPNSLLMTPLQGKDNFWGVFA